MKTLAIYGGTFDPVHNGHIQTALAIQIHFQFNAFYFLPCKDPIIKPASSATSMQRVEMLQLALQNYPEFKIDQREIERSTPSYMVETLRSFRQDEPQTALTMILGSDAFHELALWYQWQELITLTNILVIDRLGTSKIPLDPRLSDLLSVHQTHDKLALQNNLNGKIITFNAGNFEIASRVIRKKLRKEKNITKDLCPAVVNYIINNKLYL